MRCGKSARSAMDRSPQAYGPAPASVPSGVYGITMYAVCLSFTFWQRRGNAAARSLSAARPGA